MRVCDPNGGNKDGLKGRLLTSYGSFKCVGDRGSLRSNDNTVLGSNVSFRSRLRGIKFASLRISKVRLKV